MNTGTYLKTCNLGMKSLLHDQVFVFLGGQTFLTWV